MAMNDDDRDRARSGASAWDDDADLDRLDALFSGLGAGDRPEGADPAETELLGILADWRADLDERALPPLPAIPEDFGADRGAGDGGLAPVLPLTRRRGRVCDGGHHHGRRPALWQAVTGAAAVAAVLVGGLSIVAHDARPGDPLWGINKTIFSDHAGDVELVSDLTDRLAEADAAARRGDRETAARILDEVSARLGEVGDTEARVELMRRRDAIERDLVRVDPSAVPSPTPDAPAPTPAPDEPAPAPSEAPQTSAAPEAPEPAPSPQPAPPEETLTIETEAPTTAAPAPAPTTAAPEPSVDSGQMLREQKQSAPNGHGEAGTDARVKPTG